MSVQRKIILVLSLIGALITVGCGQMQADELATRAARTIAPPTPTTASPPVVGDANEAIRIARTVVSPYIATWQDVIASVDTGVWRVVFLNYDPLPQSAAQNDDYWLVPLSVFIDANTGIVLKQGYV